MRYIHVMRNGLDMAFSPNQQQVSNWGKLFNITLPVSAKPHPKDSLKYWIRANQRAIEIGERRNKHNFLLIHFERLCTSPEEIIEKMISFLDLEVDRLKKSELSKYPRLPESFGRFKEHDLSIFDAQDITIVQQLGFDIDVA